MQIDFSIGSSPESVKTLCIPDDLSTLTVNTGNSGPIVDVDLAVSEALESPIDFVPLSQSVFPGDSVAIALGPEIPATTDVLTALLKCLAKTDVSLSDVHVVVPFDSETATQLRDALSRDYETVTFSIHDPDDSEGLAYLAASEAGDPIMVNRTLCDADVVIPVTTVRHEGMLGYNGGFDGLIPEFSDAATQLRFRKAIMNGNEGDFKQRRADVRETAWLLGIQLAVRVIPDVKAGVAAVLAGSGIQLDVAAEDEYKHVWQSTPDTAPLVIASVSGTANSNHWRSIANAAHVVAEYSQANGVVVIVCDLSTSPGAATRFLADLDDDSAGRRIADSEEPDQVAAMQLLRLRQNCRIYFWCDGGQEDLEEIGIGFASDSSEIENLCSEYDRCVIIHGADRMFPAK